jgi:hypothetical protein
VLRQDVGEVVGARQALSQVEAGTHVPLGDVEDLRFSATAPWPAASKDFCIVSTAASSGERQKGIITTTLVNPISSLRRRMKS